MRWQPLTAFRLVLSESPLTSNERLFTCGVIRRTNEDGEAHPGLRRLSTDIGLSFRTTLRTASCLAERVTASDGLLVESTDKQGGRTQLYLSITARKVPGSDESDTNLYRLWLVGGDSLTPRDASETPRDAKAEVVTTGHHGGDSVTPQVVSDWHLGGDSLTPNLPLSAHSSAQGSAHGREDAAEASPAPPQPAFGLSAEPEPSKPKTAKTSKSRARKVATACPEDFAPSAGNYELGERLGFDRARVDAECDACRDYHNGKGNTWVDWHAALNTWLRREVKHERRDGASRPARIDTRQPAVPGRRWSRPDTDRDGDDDNDATDER